MSFSQRHSFINVINIFGVYKIVTPLIVYDLSKLRPEYTNSNLNMSSVSFLSGSDFISSTA